MNRPFLIMGYVDKGNRIVDMKSYGAFEDLFSAYAAFNDIDPYSEYFSLLDKHYRRHEQKRGKELIAFRAELTYKGIGSSGVQIASKSFHLPRSLIDDYLESMS